MGGRRRALGAILIEAGLITEAGLASALQEQPRSGRRLGEILLRRGLIDEERLSVSLADQLELTYMAPPLAPEPEALALVQASLARGKGVLPMHRSGRRLVVAMANPLDAGAVDDLRFQSGCHIEAAVSPPTAVAQGVLEAYGGELPELLNRLQRVTKPERAGELRLLEREARAAPIVRIVDHLIARAVEDGASDIHVETLGLGSRVRFRVDGLLRTTTELPPGTHRAAISRVKIMAGLDISVRRRPQDGGFTLTRDGRDLRVRVSTIPTRAGEKAVLR
ncbi:MAG: GspE/PulE family protein, partial [Longimicrobiales bacterium]